MTKTEIFIKAIDNLEKIEVSHSRCLINESMSRILREEHLEHFFSSCPLCIFHNRNCSQIDARNSYKELQKLLIKKFPNRIFKENDK